MKKVILLFSAMLVMLTISAQTKLNTISQLKEGVSYVAYTGVAKDTIKRVADSVYVEFINGLDAEYKLNVVTSFAKVNAADTTVQCTIWGKNSASEAYTVLNISTSGNVTNSATILSSAITTELRYRYIKVSYKLKATPKSSGVKINKIELKMWKSSGK